MEKGQEMLNKFLESMTFGTTYKVLDYGKDKNELDEVAKRHNLVFPAKDLSIFKGIYALIDIKNLNGCTLPKEEAEKALGTLTGKAVDFDHFRKKIVGYWLEGSIQDDEIVSYGVFFKGNLEEDYETITSLMNEGKLKISFEAWGNRVMTDSNGSYNLTDIEFAGGALLIDTKPAFGDRAEVLELAKVLVKPESFVKSSEDKIKNKALELSRFYTSDFEIIYRLVQEVGNPKSQEDFGYHDILSVDFLTGKVRTKWISFGDGTEDNFFTINVTPRAEEGKVTNRKLIKIEEEIKVSSQKEGELEEEEIKATEEVKKMDEQIKKLQEEKEALATEVASLKEKVAEITSALEAANAKVVEADAKVQEKASELEEAKKLAETEKAEAVKVAAENAKIVTERRGELGEFAKDMSDEDMLNGDKYEIAKLKKENSELKSKPATPEQASVTTPLVVGGKDVESEVSKRQRRIHELAFKNKSEE